MKTILTLILLTLTLFSTPTEFEANFDNLNKKIDLLNEKLTTQERISLYFMNLSIHKEITKAIITKNKKDFNITNLDNQIYKIFNSLKKQTTLYDNSEIKMLIKMYENMKRDGLLLVEESLKNNNKVIYKEKIIVENNLSMKIGIAILFLIIGVIVGYFSFDFVQEKLKSRVEIVEDEL